MSSSAQVRVEPFSLYCPYNHTAAKASFPYAPSPCQLLPLLLLTVASSYDLRILSVIFG